MNYFFKQIYLSLPRLIKRWILHGFEQYHRYQLLLHLSGTLGFPPLSLSKKSKPRILFYHLSGLSFGGTEKSLQILGKHLPAEKYERYYMYSPKHRDGVIASQDNLDLRSAYLADSGIKFIEFDFQELENKYPFFVHGMQPSIFEMINKEQIDLVITAGSGHAEFPINLIDNIPVILINIFGSASMQKNISYNVCISEAVAKKIAPFVAKDRIEVMYIPSEKPNKDSLSKGALLRQKFGIKDTDIVFGRIGRASDQIFDPIGIRAFQSVVNKYHAAHYLIMSPPPILEKIVKEDKIPNIHFLPPSGKEEDIWAFHQAQDVMAHFRKDGESCGLNIAEAMLCSKPVISHRSRIWNAHLEYLDDSFSRVADIDNVEQYAGFMRLFIELKTAGKLSEMGELARQKAEKLFLIENNIGRFEKWVEQALGSEPGYK